MKLRCVTHLSVTQTYLTDVYASIQSTNIKMKKKTKIITWAHIISFDCTFIIRLREIYLQLFTKLSYITIIFAILKTVFL